MNRKGFLKVLGAAIVAPFAPKVAKDNTAEYADRNKWLREHFPNCGAEVHYSTECTDDDEWEDYEDDETKRAEIAFSDDNGSTWKTLEVFPNNFLGWSLNDAEPDETIDVFLAGGNGLVKFKSFEAVTKGDKVTLTTIGMNVAGEQQHDNS